MSRCFSFPPPGYVWKVGGESLTELLKLRREGALLACSKKMKKKEKQFRKKDKEKPSRERKRSKRRKRVKVNDQRRDFPKRRKCEASTWWSEISCLSEELHWLTSSNSISNYRDYNKNIRDLFSLPACKFINSGSFSCKTWLHSEPIHLDMPETECESIIPSSYKLCYSSSDCALSSQSSQSSCVLQSIPEIESGHVDDLTWLMKTTSSQGKCNPHKTLPMSDDHMHTAADKSPLYQSTRYLPEVGIYALPYTVVV